MSVNKHVLFTRLLINQFAAQQAAEVAAFFDEETQKELAASSLDQADPQLLFSGFSSWLDSVHYSWLLEPIQTIKEPIRNLIIAQLPEKQQRGLMQHSLSPLAPTSSLVGQKFLFHTLKKICGDLPLLPRTFLSPSPLDPLLSLSKQELVTVIDLLSMHDLAEEMRHIVNKKLLQPIIANLSNNQQKYLKRILHQKSKATISPLNIKELYTNKSLFLKTLHKRGLKRLSIALSGGEFLFTQHLAHILDTGRGKILLDLYQQMEIPTSSTIMRQQALQIVQLIQSKDKQNGIS